MFLVLCSGRWGKAEVLQQILKAAQRATEQLKVKSALNPLLWLCTLPTTLLFAVAFLFDHSNTLRPFCGAIIWVALGIVVLTGLSAVYLVICQPDKLQSEEYQLRQQALLLIQQSGSATQPISATDIVTLIKSTPSRR